MFGVDMTQYHQQTTVMNTYPDDDYYRIRKSLMNSFGTLDEEMIDHALGRQAYATQRRLFSGTIINALTKDDKTLIELVSGPWSYRGELLEGYGGLTQRNEYISQMEFPRTMFRSISLNELRDPLTAPVVLATTDIKSIAARIKLSMGENYYLVTRDVKYA